MVLVETLLTPSGDLALPAVGLDFESLALVGDFDLAGFFLALWGDFTLLVLAVATILECGGCPFTGVFLAPSCNFAVFGVGEAGLKTLVGDLLRVFLGALGNVLGEIFRDCLSTFSPAWVFGVCFLEELAK